MEAVTVCLNRWTQATHNAWTVESF